MCLWDGERRRIRCFAGPFGRQGGEEAIVEEPFDRGDRDGAREGEAEALHDC